MKLILNLFVFHKQNLEIPGLQILAVICLCLCFGIVLDGFAYAYNSYKSYLLVSSTAYLTHINQKICSGLYNYQGFLYTFYIKHLNPTKYSKTSVRNYLHPRSLTSFHLKMIVSQKQSLFPGADVQVAAASGV